MGWDVVRRGQHPYQASGAGFCMRMVNATAVVKLTNRCEPPAHTTSRPPHHSPYTALEHHHMLSPPTQSTRQRLTQQRGCLKHNPTSLHAASLRMRSSACHQATTVASRYVQAAAFAQQQHALHHRCSLAVTGHQRCSSMMRQRDTALRDLQPSTTAITAKQCQGVLLLLC